MFSEYQCILCCRLWCVLLRSCELYVLPLSCQGSSVIPHHLAEQKVVDHATRLKQRKVVFDGEDDSASDGESVDKSDIDASSEGEGEEGTDGNVMGLKLLAKTKQKKRKNKQKEKEANNSEGHSSADVSGLFDSEAIEDHTNVDFDEDYHGVEAEDDQASEDGSGGLVHSEAEEDNRHLEFEEDFSGEDSEDEEDGSNSTDEDVVGSDSDMDASDDDESDEFESFVVEDEEVLYASEDDGLDQLDEMAEMVSQKKRGAHFLEEDSIEEPMEAEQASPQKPGTSSRALHRATDGSLHLLSHQSATRKPSRPLQSRQGHLHPNLQPGRRKRHAHFMDHTDSGSDRSAEGEGMSGSKEGAKDESVSHSSSEELTSEVDEGEEGSNSEENEKEEVGEEEGEEEDEEGEEEEEKEENGEMESAADGDNLDSFSGALQWKTDLSTRAASSFLHRQQKKIDLQKLIYDPEHSICLQQIKDPLNEAEEGNELGGIFTPRVASTDIEHMQDVTRKSRVVAHDWTREDLVASMKDLMVTGRWGEEEDAQTLLQQDQDLYGDFEDLETGEKHGAKEGHVGGADEGEGPQNLLEKKRQLKEAFDKEYDDKEGEKDYFSELKDSYSRQAEMNRQEFEGIDENLRLQLEGARLGSYIRIETRGMPCEFVEDLDPHKPIIVGGLLPGETRLGYVTVRIKRHRWYKRILKSSDPLILSLGWRRFQTLPVYFKREDNLRQRYLKYTPEHLHCNATLYGPLTTPGTGLIGVQTVSDSGVSGVTSCTLHRYVDVRDVLPRYHVGMTAQSSHRIAWY